MKPDVFPKLLLAGAMASVLAACGGDSDDDDNNTTAEVRVIHASSDAPDVNASLDGGNQVGDLAFADATPFLEVPAKDYEVTVDGIVPGDENPTVIGPATVPLDADAETSIVAVGKVGDDSIVPLVVTAPDADPADDEARAQVVHAASGAPEVDIYVTDPSADITISDVDPITTLSFPSFADPVTVPSGDYRIQVTPAGDPSTVVFDSGTVPLAGDLLVAAIDNVGPNAGTDPVRLLVAREGSDSFVLTDAGAQAAVRAAHLSSDTPNVDVTADGFSSLLYQNVSFPAVAPYTLVDEGTVDVDVGLTGNNTAAVSLPGAMLDGGTWTSVYAVGQLNGSPALELIAGDDDIRSVATEGRLRVVHAASQVPGANGAVDVYVAPDGTPASDVSTLDPSVPGFEYKEISGYLSVPAGDYEVFVTPADLDNAVIEAGLTLNAGDVKTVVARDAPSESSGFAALPVDETP